MSEFKSTACECVKYLQTDHAGCFDYKTGDTGYVVSLRTNTNYMTFTSVPMQLWKLLFTCSVIQYPQLLKSWANYAYAA